MRQKDPSCKLRVIVDAFGVSVKYVLQPCYCIATQQQPTNYRLSIKSHYYYYCYYYYFNYYCL